MVGENLHQSWESWFFNSRRGLVGLSSFEDWHFKHICPTQKLDENLPKTTQKSKLHNSTVVFFLPIHFSDNCAQCSYGFYQEGDFCHHSELVAQTLEKMLACWNSTHHFALMFRATVSHFDLKILHKVEKIRAFMFWLSSMVLSRHTPQKLSKTDSRGLTIKRSDSNAQAFFNLGIVMAVFWTHKEDIYRSLMDMNSSTSGWFNVVTT